MTPSKYDPEYREFLASDEGKDGTGVSSELLSIVHRDLNPRPSAVFAKLFAIHVATSIVTLAICPQFGTRSFGEGMGLMHYFMGLGEHGCLVACGAFFTGASLLAAGLVLRGEELRTIREHRWLELGAIAMLSLGFFVMADGFRNLQLLFGASFVVAWIVGTLLGGAASLELAWRMRFRTAV